MLLRSICPSKERVGAVKVVRSDLTPHHNDNNKHELDMPSQGLGLAWRAMQIRIP